MPISLIEIPDAPVAGDIHQQGKVKLPWVRWFQQVKKQAPFFPIDTSVGNISLSLPTFPTTAAAAEYINREHLYLKSTADGNTVTISGAAVGGPVVLNAQGQKARFRFDGKNWWAV